MTGFQLYFVGNNWIRKVYGGGKDHESSYWFVSRLVRMTFEIPNNIRTFPAELLIKSEFKRSFSRFSNENRYLEVREVGNKIFEYGDHGCGPFICRFEVNSMFPDGDILTLVFQNAFYCLELMEYH